MRFFLLLRLIPRLIRGLARGEPWAIWTVVGLAAVIGVTAFIQFARKPLGGDPEAPPIPDDAFLDAKNPYRDL